MPKNKNNRFAVGFIALILVGCTTEKNAVPLPIKPRIELTLSPSFVSVSTLGKVAFQAYITGTSSSEIVWSIVESGGGSISDKGDYLAPGKPGAFHVEVRLSEYPEVASSATVLVTSPATCIRGGLAGVVYFSGPGPDLEWETDDDEISAWDGKGAGEPSSTILYVGPGSDMIWLNEDDEIFSYYTVTSASEYEVTTFFDIGLDGKWFSVDDTGSKTTDSYANGQIVKHEVRRSDGTIATLRSWNYSAEGTVETQTWWSAGMDSVLGNADDEIARLFKYYGENATKEVVYSGPGMDEIWESEDDEVYRWGVREFDSSGLRVAFYEYESSGEDLIWFTGDEVITTARTWRYIESILIGEVISNGVGLNGIWFDSDDDLYLYSRLSYYENGDLDKEIYFTSFGNDHVWMTGDDVIYSIQKSIYDCE